MKECKHPCCGETCRKKKERKKAKPIRKRSKKMSRAMELYNLKRIAFLKENPVCPITGEPTTDIHHKAGRIGKLLLDKTLWLAVSRRGHIIIEENPDWAKEMGYSVSRLNKRA